MSLLSLYSVYVEGINCRIKFSLQCFIDVAKINEIVLFTLLSLRPSTEQMQPDICNAEYIFKQVLCYVIQTASGNTIHT